MQIDWFTFAAQIINFLVLVWLLKRFLYRPILNVMAERERRVAARAEAADARSAEAADKQRQYETRLAEFEAVKGRLHEQALAEAEAERAAAIERSRQEVAETRAAWLETLEQEKIQQGEELRRRLAAGLCQTARLALGELADANLEQEVVASFVRRIDTLDKPAVERLVSAVRAAANGLQIKTAFDLTDDQRWAIRQRLEAVVGGSVQVRFERDADIVCGIVLDTPEISIEWSVREYSRRLAVATGLAGTAE